MLRKLSLASICLLVVFGLPTARAEDEEAHWGPVQPLPENLDKKETIHYGRPIELLTPAQREALWKARIRKDHPRLFITKETRPEQMSRVPKHPAWPLIVAAADAGHPLASAFVYQMTGELPRAKRALVAFDDAHFKGDPTLAWNGTVLALVYDWCYDAIPTDNLEDITRKLADVTGLEKSEKGLQQFSFRRNRYKADRWAHWRFNFNLQDCLYPLIALAHHWPGAHVEAANWWHPDGSDIGTKMGDQSWGVDGSFAGSGHWTYWLPRSNECKLRLAVRSATGLDLLDEKAFGSNTNNAIFWFMYISEFNGGHLDHWWSFEFDETHPLRHWKGADLLFLWNQPLRNPYYAWFLNHVVAPGGWVERVKAISDPDERVMSFIDLALWWDPSLPEKSPDDLPRARFLAPGQTMHASFRSGFLGKGDARVTMLLGPGYIGDSDHSYQFGSFNLFRDEYLASMNKGAHFTIPKGHNGLCFVDTSTREKTGWDKQLEPILKRQTPSIEYWVSKFVKTQIGGTVTAFETRKDYDYLAFTQEPCYYETDKVKEWTGQVVFLRPGVFIRFDRTEVTEDRYQPRFNLWCEADDAKGPGKLIKTIVPGHVGDYDGDEVSYLGHLHQSRLHWKVLLPKEKHVRLAVGSITDLPSENLLLSSQSVMVAGSEGLKRGGAQDFRIKGKVSSPETGEMEVDVLGFSRGTGQKVAGPFKVEVKKDSLQIAQPAAGKDRKYRFQWFPTIKDLVEAATGDGFGAELSANFEDWVEGNRHFRRDTHYRDNLPRPPRYQSDGSLAEEKRKALLAGDHSNRPDLIAPWPSGHYEVRLNGLTPGKRQYFLNVFTLADAEGKTVEVPVCRLEETETEATAVLQFRKETIYLTFAKTGKLAGQITVREDDKQSMKRAFTEKIEMDCQPLGSDFVTGRKVSPVE